MIPEFSWLHPKRKDPADQLVAKVKSLVGEFANETENPPSGLDQDSVANMILPIYKHGALAHVMLVLLPIDGTEDQTRTLLSLKATLPDMVTMATQLVKQIQAFSPPAAERFVRELPTLISGNDTTNRKGV